VTARERERERERGLVTHKYGTQRIQPPIIMKALRGRVVSEAKYNAIRKGVNYQSKPSPNLI